MHGFISQKRKWNICEKKYDTKKNLNLFIEIKYNKNEVLIQQKDHSYILFNKKNKTLLSLQIQSAVSMIQKLAIQGKWRNSRISWFSLNRGGWGWGGGMSERVAKTFFLLKNFFFAKK